jgi:dTDP-4-amino-4,6-dideoxygalactose transaminase
MINITKPFLGTEEARAAYDTVMSGWLTQGPRVREFEEKFARWTGAPYACAVSNCTTAMHLALLAVGVEPGDLVVTVSHSFIATANSIRYCGAEPVFVDIDPLTFNMSSARLEEFLSRRCVSGKKGVFFKQASALAVGESPLRYLVGQKNKRTLSKIGRIAAVMPVHQMGMPCDLEAILGICRRYRLPVVEDAACAAGSETFSRKTKTWEKIGKPHGDVACFSFHPRKIITTGDGGMLTTRNPRYDRRFRLLRQHAMSVSDTSRHQSAKVVFEAYPVTGFNYRMTDVQAGVGSAQMDRLAEIVAARRRLAANYRNLLSGIPGLGIPSEGESVRTNWQSYCVRLPKGFGQRKVMQAMLDRGISTRRGIMCAHREKAYAPSSRYFDLRESERAQDRCILLPLYPQMEEAEQKQVAEALSEILKS